MNFKIKFYEGKVSTNFLLDKISKESFHCYYNSADQIYLQECKYKIKARNINTFVNNDVEYSSHDDDYYYGSRKKYSGQFTFIGFLVVRCDIFQFLPFFWKIFLVCVLCVCVSVGYWASGICLCSGLC